MVWAAPSESLRPASGQVFGSSSRRSGPCLLPTSFHHSPWQFVTSRPVSPAQAVRGTTLHPWDTSFPSVTFFGIDNDGSGLEPSSGRSQSRSWKVPASRHSSNNFSRQRMAHHHQHHHYWDDWVEREDLQAMWQCPEVRQQWQDRYNAGGVGKVPFRTVTSAGRVVPVLTIEGEWRSHRVVIG